MIATIVTITKVIVACCANVFLLEAISKEAPGSANLITFAQFLCVALQGILVQIFFGKPRVIPLSEYAKLVILFFFVSTSNNFALNFNISVPLHVIFKSGSLLANLLLGIIILKRKYSLSKYLAVFFVTVGVILCTISSYENPTFSTDEAVLREYQNTWILGIIIMSIALFTSAFMGIYQEKLYKKYGSHHQEALFYCHLLPLPGFLLLWPDLSKQITTFAQSPLVPVILSPYRIPKLIIYLYLNSITQLICVSSVFQLSANHTSLTVTLVITLRKFFSLVISTIYFNNLFTFNHWIGASLVFLGTLLFTDIHKQLLPSRYHQVKSKSD